MATLQEALSIALDHQIAGRTAEAEELYGRILDAAPEEPNALHLLGLLHAQSGRLDRAEALIGRAAALCPGAGDVHANHGKVLRALGRDGAAAQAFHTALSLCPESPELALSLVTLDQAAGRHDRAAAAARRLLTLQPELGEGALRLGTSLRHAGAFADAARWLRRAVRLRADTAAAWHQLAIALMRLRDREAVPVLRTVIGLDPANVQARLNLGRALRDAGRHADAALAFRSALALDPGLGVAHDLLAKMLAVAATPAEAAAVAGRAVRVEPQATATWDLYGRMLRRSGRPAAAVAAFDRALALDPGMAAAMANRANAIGDPARIADCLTCHDRAERLAPDEPMIRWNRALVLLLAGRYREGWEGYEARWSIPGFPTKPRGFAQPLWQGGDISGRTILLYEEQGRGDAIQFVRYAPLVAARGARVVLEVGADLVDLMRSVTGVAEVVARGAPLPAFDVQCPLVSLPRAFGTTPETIPARVPYLHADPRRAAAWRPRLAGPGPAVGLVWAGNPVFPGDSVRSPGLPALRPLLAVPGVRVYGLQVGPGRDALAGFTAPPGFTDLGPEIRDFADTAAIMANLDLVISSCTAPAHLAGALGVPLWVLLAHGPDWRWLLERADSPWYPTARLFRQPSPGDWTSVAGDAAAALAAFRDAGQARRTSGVV
ncbi:tetratricopeptide repeat protein [Azospirillum halopraeferens]|uniref:tetratricopeptide repeat protein n=1 Tax=Azospirillum halopraeferens TaxID=34010 RepID=UPI0004104413|nr:tetratricopeptide repeat protein [Azospirillum halopraeferens]